MAISLFFVNKSTGKEYRVISLDREQTPPMLILKGQHSEFQQAFDKELFQRLGYELVKKDEPDDAE